MIRTGAEFAQVVVETRADDRAQGPVTLGVRRDKTTLVCRLNGEKVERRSQLAEALPVQWIGSQPQQFLDQGPEVRRHFVDMGVFHVEHGYLASLTQFNRILRQRNAALRSGDSAATGVWDAELVSSAERISAARQRLIEALLPRVTRFIDAWGGGFIVDYRYRRGWRSDAPLAQQLIDKRDTDLRLGYTTVGPQRAELELLANGDVAQKRLSRGQQKLLVIALNLALFDLVGEQTGIRPLIMIDDLAAELDQHNRATVTRVLVERSAQVFVSQIDDSALSLPCDQGDVAMFHVEQGELIG